jgi:hypothetical protein
MWCFTLHDLRLLVWCCSRCFLKFPNKALRPLLLKLGIALTREEESLVWLKAHKNPYIILKHPPERYPFDPSKCHSGESCSPWILFRLHQKIVWAWKNKVLLSPSFTHCALGIKFLLGRWFNYIFIL